MGGRVSYRVQKEGQINLAAEIELFLLFFVFFWGGVSYRVQKERQINLAAEIELRLKAEPLDGARREPETRIVEPYLSECDEGT